MQLVLAIYDFIRIGVGRSFFYAKQKARLLADRRAFLLDE